MAIKRLTVQFSASDAKIDALIEKLKTKGVISAVEADDAKKGKK